MASQAQPSAPISNEAFQGPISSMKMAGLIALCSSLGLDSTGNNDKRKKRINDYLKSHEGLADDPRYQGLFAYRANKLSVPTASKKSVDKVKEDAIEAAKDVEPTGAHKTLLSKNVPIAPPAQFVRLTAHGHSKIQAQAQSTINADRNSNRNSDESSPEAPPMPFSSQTGPINVSDDEGGQDCPDDGYDESQINPVSTPTPNPSTPVNKKGHSQAFTIMDHRKSSSPNPFTESVKKDVIVSFRDFLDDSKPPLEVIVPRGEVPIAREVGNDTQPLYTTRLSDLLPAAIENMSPKKAPFIRLYRAGQVSADSRIQIGSIASVLGRSSRPLKIDFIDSYSLQESSKGFLVCDVFTDNGEDKDIGTISGKAAPMPPTPLKPDYVPLEVAQSRRSALSSASGHRSSTGSSDSSSNLSARTRTADDPFIQFLRRRRRRGSQKMNQRAKASNES
ncbi:hypothetical protein CPC08DRAFT_770889 [Agrocybe pediades]|nr:hypothetical protein CPC08DRAFT_770889 [Agrocybe pediades]